MYRYIAFKGTKPVVVVIDASVKNNPMGYRVESLYDGGNSTIPFVVNSRN